MKLAALSARIVSTDCPKRRRSALACAVERLEGRVLLAGDGYKPRFVFDPLWADVLAEPKLRKPGRGIAAPQDLVAPESLSSGSTIEALNFDQNAAATGFYQIPPDSHAAVGPNHIVNVVNSTIEWYTKAGTRQNRQRLGKNSTTATGSFFAPVSPVNGTFDPKIVYDQYNGRFVLVSLEQQDTALGDPTDSSRVLLAVSDDSDPNGTWYFGSINTKMRIQGQQRWFDYPGLAVDEEALYLTGNMFSFGVSGQFGASRLWIIPKSTWYAGGAFASNLYNPSQEAGLTSQAFTLQPSHMYGSGPGGVGTFLLSSGWVSGSTDALSVIRVDDPLSSPSFTNQFVLLGNVHNTSVAFPSAAPQPGTAESIDAGDNRVLSAVWRDNALWAANTVNPVSGTDSGTATAHWYRINTSNVASLTLADQGNVGGEDIAAGTRTFYPAIMVDSLGNMGLGFSASGSTVYAGAYYTGREAADAAGTVQGSVVLAAGQDYYIRKFGGSRNRWGDYSGLALDPSDQTTFWLFNEYALPRGTILSGLPNEDGRWGTRIGSFSFVAPPPPTGAIAGVVYRDNDTDGTQDAGEIAQDGVTLFLDADNDGTLDVGESSTITSGGGTYTFTSLASGTYNLRQVTPAGHIVVTPAGGAVAVAVVNGSTSTQDFTNFPTVFDGGSGDDAWTVRTDPTLSTRMQVLASLGGGPLTIYQILKSTYNAAGVAFTFNGTDGDDAVTIDNSVAPALPAAGVIINGGADATAGGDQIIFTGGTGSDALSLGNGTATFAGNVTMSGIEGLTASLGDGSDTLNYDAPATPLTFSGGTGDDTFNLNAGSYAFESDAITGTASLTLNVNAGSAIFNSSQHLANLTIASGASAVMTAHGNRFLQAAGLSITGSGKLDLNDNDLIVDYTGPTPLTQVLQWIVAGFSSVPDASKTGIVSTTSQTTGGNAVLALFDTALALQSEWPSGSGNTVDATCVIGKYTYFGDANIDGQVTGDDYAVVDSNLDTDPPEGLEWLSGDANLDGIVTGDDYATIDSNLGAGVGNPL